MFNSAKEKPVIIFGNGSMARVLYSYMKEKYNIAAFCVDKQFINSNTFCSKPLVAFEDIEHFYKPDDFSMMISIGFINMNNLREERFGQAQNKGFKLISYIDETVRIHNNVTIGKNCIILDFVSIHPDSVISDGTFISSNVSIGHDCKIGKFNWINSNVSIAGYVNVGEKCFWGVNSCAGNNINIGNKNYIAANTLISKNTEDNNTYISENSTKHRLSSTNFLKFIGS